MATKRKKIGRSKKTAKLDTNGVSRKQAEHFAGEIIDNALARSKAAPTEADAAVAVARAWLAKAGFHEDPDGENPERVEFGFSDVGSDRERYVNVRVYVPTLDIEHVLDGTHPDGITATRRPKP
jgi:hypothetical protein